MVLEIAAFVSNYFTFLKILRQELFLLIFKKTKTFVQKAQTFVEFENNFLRNCKNLESIYIDALRLLFKRSLTAYTNASFFTSKQWDANITGIL